MRIALLEDDERRIAAMSAALARLDPDVELLVFDNAPAMVAWLRTDAGGLDAILLDHDLGPTRVLPTGECFDPGDGRDVTAALRAIAVCCPVLIHSSNSLAVPTMLQHLDDSGWTARRVVPFNDLQWVEASWLPELESLLAVRRDGV